MRAMGTFRPGSDIDLTLESDNLSLDRLQEIQMALEELDLPYQIDLSHFESLTNPEFVEHIKRVGVEFV